MYEGKKKELVNSHMKIIFMGTCSDSILKARSKLATRNKKIKLENLCF